MGEYMKQFEDDEEARYVPDWDYLREHPDQMETIDGMEIPLKSILDAMQLWHDDNKEWPTEEEFQTILQSVLVDASLKELDEEGLIETCINDNGDIAFQLTPSGLKAANKLFGE